MLIYRKVYINRRIAVVEDAKRINHSIGMPNVAYVVYNEIEIFFSINSEMHEIAKHE